MKRENIEKVLRKSATGKEQKSIPEEYYFRASHYMSEAIEHTRELERIEADLIQQDAPKAPAQPQKMIMPAWIELLGLYRWTIIGGTVVGYALGLVIGLGFLRSLVSAAFVAFVAGFCFNQFATPAMKDATTKGRKN